MIPESSLHGDVALYKCVRFPDKWERHATLLSGLELADVTITQHNGLNYLFGAWRDGTGGYSDSLAIYYAEHLLGPVVAPCQQPGPDRSRKRATRGEFRHHRWQIVAAGAGLRRRIWRSARPRGSGRTVSDDVQAGRPPLPAARTGMARQKAAHAEPLRPARGDRRIACSTQDPGLRKQISIGSSCRREPVPIPPASAWHDGRRGSQRRPSSRVSTAPAGRRRSTENDPRSSPCTRRHCPGSRASSGRSSTVEAGFLPLRMPTPELHRAPRHEERVLRRGSLDLRRCRILQRGLDVGRAVDGGDDDAAAVELLGREVGADRLRIVDGEDGVDLGEAGQMALRDGETAFARALARPGRGQDLDARVLAKTFLQPLTRSITAETCGPFSMMTSPLPRACRRCTGRRSRRPGRCSVVRWRRRRRPRCRPRRPRCRPPAPS